MQMQITINAGKVFEFIQNEVDVLSNLHINMVELRIFSKLVEITMGHQARSIFMNSLERRVEKEEAYYQMQGSSLSVYDKMYRAMQVERREEINNEILRMVHEAGRS